jgi:hypothetical protein
MTVYVTLMCRYGSESDGAYVLGVWSDEHEAMAHGKIEESWRGGKYQPKVFPFEIDGNEYDEGVGKPRFT